jgi:hypothetical protein
MTFREELQAKYPKAARRAALGQPTACIKLFCLECVGGVRQDITDCTDSGCPLYLVRPYRKPAPQGGIGADSPLASQPEAHAARGRCE